MLRFFLFTLFCPLVMACAEKKYVQGSSGGGAQGKLSGTCESRFQLPSLKFCVSFNWEKPQAGKKPGVGIVKFWRPNLADGSPVVSNVGDAVEVVLWMPHMGGGHGSDPVTVEQADVGTYRAKRVFFSMPGQWEIRVFVKQGGAVIDQIYLPFTF